MAVPRLLFLITDDRYFVSHRLPMARAARDAGFDVHVATKVADYRAPIIAEGFTLHELGWSKLRRKPHHIIRDILEIRHLYKVLGPDVVHHVALVPIILGQLAATGLSVASVNTVAGLGSGFIGLDPVGRLLRQGLSTALRMLLNRPSTLTVVQNEDDRRAVEQIGVAPDKIRLVPGSGVDTDRIRPLPEPQGPITVGVAARMLDDKGIRPLVAAQQKLQAEGQDIRLILAGDPDLANRTAIRPEELTHFASLPGISWLGHVENIESLWAQCHIAALPSRREGLPKALLEAAAVGRPLIATDVPGCRDVAIDGKTGLLVPVDDAARLADAISLLAGNSALRKEMGSAARSFVETRFSAEAIGAASLTLYRSLTQKPIEVAPRLI
ncbi:MAG: glycosyltransferase family 4 protein [Alphaproteobacteria bacterium]